MNPLLANAFVDELEKLAKKSLKTQVAEGNVLEEQKRTRTVPLPKDIGSDLPESNFPEVLAKAKKDYKQEVPVPLRDPSSGRTFAHKERWKQQSLEHGVRKVKGRVRVFDRGPGWKDTHPPEEQPGKPGGPASYKPELYWSDKGKVR